MHSLITITVSSRGSRSGKSVSISWPLWRDGGMHVNSAVEKDMKKNLGLSRCLPKLG